MVLAKTSLFALLSALAVAAQNSSYVIPSADGSDGWAESYYRAKGEWTLKWRNPLTGRLGLQDDSGGKAQYYTTKYLQRTGWSCDETGVHRFVLCGR